MKKFQKIFYVIILASTVAALGFSHYVNSGTGQSLSGYGWEADTGPSGTDFGGLGWLSFNNCIGGTCSGPDYGVNIDPSTGNVTGDAWSSNFGWLHFGGFGSGFPASGGTVSQDAKLDWAQNPPKMIGWARFCAVFQSGCSGALKSSSDLGGWDGWVSLSGTSPDYKVILDTFNGHLTGYAWAGNAYDTNSDGSISASERFGPGWINFTGPNFTVSCSNCPSLTLTANNTPTALSVSGGTPVNLNWSSLLFGTYDITSCSTSETLPGGAASTGWVGTGRPINDSTSSYTYTLNTAGTYNFTITCTGSGSVTIASSVAVTVTSSVPSVSVAIRSANYNTDITQTDFNYGDKIKIHWDATVENTALSNVECTGTGTTNINNDTSSTWISSPAGTYEKTSSGTSSQFLIRTASNTTGQEDYTFTVSCRFNNNNTVSDTKSTTVTAYQTSGGE